MEIEKILENLIEHKGNVDAKLEGIEKILDDFTHNHFPHIYKELKCLVKKLSSRPSWAVCFILTFLCTTIGVLLVVIFK